VRNMCVCVVIKLASWLATRIVQAVLQRDSDGSEGEENNCLLCICLHICWSKHFIISPL
jgi:hypothetical protein